MIRLKLFENEEFSKVMQKQNTIELQSVYPLVFSVSASLKRVKAPSQRRRFCYFRTSGTFVISFVKSHVKCFLECADLFLNTQLFACAQMPVRH
nr:MAG TPA: hypothetical protein [Caudoviricetes sp.]